MQAMEYHAGLWGNLEVAGVPVKLIAEVTTTHKTMLEFIITTDAYVEVIEYFILVLTTL